MSDLSPIAPTPMAHVVICPRCENPELVGNLPDDSPGMQCPECGFSLRPTDLNTYRHKEDRDDA